MKPTLKNNKQVEAKHKKRILLLLKTFENRDVFKRQDLRNRNAAIVDIL